MFFKIVNNQGALMSKLHSWLVGVFQLKGRLVSHCFAPDSMRAPHRCLIAFAWVVTVATT